MVLQNLPTYLPTYLPNLGALAQHSLLTGINFFTINLYLILLQTAMLRTLYKQREQLLTIGSLK